jgi:hypothetical protein
VTSCGVCGLEQPAFGDEQVVFPIVDVATGFVVYRCSFHINKPWTECEKADAAARLREFRNCGVSAVAEVLAEQL